MIIEYRYQIYSNTNEDGLKESIRHVILGHSRLDLQTMTYQSVQQTQIKDQLYLNAKSSQASLDII